MKLYKDANELNVSSDIYIFSELYADGDTALPVLIKYPEDPMELGSEPNPVMDIDQIVTADEVFPRLVEAYKCSNEIASSDEEPTEEMQKKVCVAMDAAIREMMRSRVRGIISTPIYPVDVIPMIEPMTINEGFVMGYLSPTIYSDSSIQTPLLPVMIPTKEIIEGMKSDDEDTGFSTFSLEGEATKPTPIQKLAMYYAQKLEEMKDQNGK